MSATRDALVGAISDLIDVKIERAKLPPGSPAPDIDYANTMVEFRASELTGALKNFETELRGEL